MNPASSTFPAGNFWCSAQRLAKYTVNILHSCFGYGLYFFTHVLQPDCVCARAGASISTRWACSAAVTTLGILGNKMQG